MDTPIARHASRIVGLSLVAVLALACTEPSDGGASGAPAPSVAPAESAAPGSGEPAPPVDDDEY